MFVLYRIVRIRFTHSLPPYLAKDSKWSVATKLNLVNLIAGYRRSGSQEALLLAGYPMAIDYENFYQNSPHGLGEPTKEFVRFFNECNEQSLEVLDVGCGQGRDVFFIARLGHDVTAVDISPTGVGDVVAEAKSEGLSITGVVADICDHEWQGQFDVVVIDRTLHMLGPDERIQVLRCLLGITKAGSHVLIADERSNISTFSAEFEESQWDWTPTLARKGFLFMVRQ